VARCRNLLRHAAQGVIAAEPAFASWIEPERFVVFPLHDIALSGGPPALHSAGVFGQGNFMIVVGILVRSEHHRRVVAPDVSADVSDVLNVGLVKFQPFGLGNETMAFGYTLTQCSRRPSKTCFRPGWRSV